VGQGDRCGDNVRVGQREQQRAADENHSTHASLHGRRVLDKRPNSESSSKEMDLFSALEIHFRTSGKSTFGTKWNFFDLTR